MLGTSSKSIINHHVIQDLGVDDHVPPVSGDAAHDDFDYFQSANRMGIECAFGILVTQSMALSFRRKKEYAQS